MSYLDCEAWWTKCDETHEGDLDEAQAEGWIYHAFPSPSRWFCPIHAPRANEWRENLIHTETRRRERMQPVGGMI